MRVGKQSQSKYIECPFFHYYDGKKISCEGVKGSESIHLVFDSPDKRRVYQKAVCSLQHQKCIVAQALYKKWET